MREDSLAAVRRLAEGEPRYRAVVADIERLVRDLPDPMSRSTRTAHFTASGVIVRDSTDQVLLMFHRKLQLWLQTGGHCEPGESLQQAALREATEESGLPSLELLPEPIDIDVHPVPCGGGTSLHLDVRFACALTAGATAAPGSAESEAVRWFSLSELPPGTPEGTRRAARAAVARVR